MRLENGVFIQLQGRLCFELLFKPFFNLFDPVKYLLTLVFTDPRFGFLKVFSLFRIPIKGLLRCLLNLITSFVLLLAIDIRLILSREIGSHFVISSVVCICTILVEPVFEACELLHLAFSLTLDHVLLMVLFPEPVPKSVDRSLKIVPGHVSLLLVVISLLVPPQSCSSFFKVFGCELGGLAILDDV